MFAAINPQPRPHINSQLEHARTNALVISEVPGTHPCQAGVHCGLHSQVAQGLEPVIKRHPAILQFQLPDFAFGHCLTVNYRLQLSTCDLTGGSKLRALRTLRGKLNLDDGIWDGGVGWGRIWTVPPVARRPNPNSEGRNPKEGRIPKAEAMLEHFGFRVSAFFRRSDFGFRVWTFALTGWWYCRDMPVGWWP